MPAPVAAATSPLAPVSNVITRNGGDVTLNGLNIASAQAPGEDADSLANKLVDAIARRLHLSGLSTSGGGGITINVQQQPGESTDDFVNRLVRELTKRLHLSGLGTSLGQGVYESSFLHGTSF